MKKLEELTEMYRTLGQDVTRSFQPVSADPSNQYALRAFVRALFAYFEGMCFCMKQVVSLILKHGTTAAARALQQQYGPEFVFLLDEIDHVIDDTGKLKERSANISLRGNIQFAFRLLGATADPEYQLDKGPGWEALLDAIKIRDRITHPRSRDAICISPEEIDTLSSAFSWMQESADIIDQAIEKNLKKLDAEQPAEELQNDPRTDHFEP